jgi:hypothetical protein
MGMYINTAPNPVDKSYEGQDTFNLNKLRDFWSATHANFQNIQTEIGALRLELNTARYTNKQLTQLLNWIATTNPQILHEFQTSAHAFDKLVPRSDGVESGPCASP